MTYDYQSKKLVAVIDAGLSPGIALNVVAHLAIAIAACAGPDLLGRPQLEDGSHGIHLGIAKYPIIVTKAKCHHLRPVIDNAKVRGGLIVADFPKHMLATGHDDDLARALSDSPEEQLVYLGFAIFGKSGLVSQLTGKFSLYR